MDQDGSDRDVSILRLDESQKEEEKMYKAVVTNAT